MRRLAILSLATVLSGCTLTPHYQRPQALLPQGLEGQQSTSGAQAFPWADWWTAFNDPQLTALIQRALAANLDVEQSAARVRQARAALGMARSDYWPTVGGQAQASRKDAPNYQVQGNQADPANSFALSGLLNYEVDLFGRVRASNAAATQDLLSSAYAHQSLRSLIASETATTYFNLVAARERLKLAQESARTRSDALGVQEKRAKAGYSTELELAQARAELADAQVLIPDLRRSIALLESSLRVLTGEQPRALWDGPLQTSDTLPEPPAVPMDVMPASLLERRPDIRAAEAQLKAANDRVGVARALRWPTLSISGLLGLQSNDLGELFDKGSRTWSIGAGAAGPIYDFGYSRNRTLSAVAARDVADFNYRSVVLNAFQELRDAITVRDSSEEALQARTQQANAFDRLLGLSKQQYNAGYVDQLQYLDAERGQLSSQLSLVDARLDRLVSTVTLYRALGGGWNSNADVTMAR